MTFLTTTDGNCRDGQLDLFGLAKRLVLIFECKLQITMNDTNVSLSLIDVPVRLIPIESQLKCPLFQISN